MSRGARGGTVAPGLSDGRVLARAMAGLMLAGGVLGSLNLVVDGALRSGPVRWGYAAGMLACLVAGLAVVMRPALAHRGAALWVVLGDTLYLLAATAVVDAQLYATPLMLLFVTLFAAWMLGPRLLTGHLVAVYPLCWAALSPSMTDVTLLAVQCVVQGTVLTATAAVVYRLRRRSEQLLEAMHRVSTTDPLTGLPNRRALEEQVPHLWRRASAGGRLLAALVLDLDHFKQVNDGHGHAVGDQVLTAVAAVVREAVRGGDLVARTGGEEIVVLTPVRSPTEAWALAERLRQAVAAARMPVSVTTSLGVATASPAGTRNEVEAMWRLVDRADAAMYRAKGDGRDRSVLAEAPPH